MARPGDIQLSIEPQEIWSTWAPRLTTCVLPCGHFLPEQAPEDVINAIDRLLRT